MVGGGDRTRRSNCRQRAWAIRTQVLTSPGSTPPTEGRLRGILDAHNQTLFAWKKQANTRAGESGLLHVLTAELRPRFVASLSEAIVPGGTYLVLGYADDDPGRGPPGFSPDTLRDTFAEGWQINYIQPAQFDINATPDHKNRAWPASIRRS